MAVVCAGPKAILDVPATLEYLETRGVPVVAIGQDDLPGLLRPLERASRSPQSVAGRRGGGRDSSRVHLGLGLGGGILVCVPVPAAEALPDDVAGTPSSGPSREADDGRDRAARRSRPGSSPGSPSSPTARRSARTRR